MATHNICIYKEVDKKYARCKLKTTNLLDCALIGVCAIIRSNTVLSSALQNFAKQGNRNAKRTEKHKNKITQGKT